MHVCTRTTLYIYTHVHTLHTHTMTRTCTHTLHYTSHMVRYDILCCSTLRVWDDLRRHTKCHSPAAYIVYGVPGPEPSFVLTGEYIYRIYLVKRCTSNSRCI